MITTETDTRLTDVQPGEILVGCKLVTITMGELGDRLPQGIDGLETTFTLKRPNNKVRRALGAITGQIDLKKHPGRMICHWLAEAVATLNGEALTGSAEKKALQIARLPAGDVLYLIFAWKRNASRRGLRIGGAACGACDKEWGDVRVKLDTLEVTRLEAGADSTAVIGLYDPWPWDSDKEVNSVLIRPPIWLDCYWNLSASGWRNAQLVTSQIFRASIKGVDCGELPGFIPDASLDEMLPDDEELLDDALEKITPTLDMTIEVKCPDCGKTNQTALDWMDQGFLRGSARV